MVNGLFYMYIDESGSPYFNASLPPNEGYCSCVTVLPVEDVLAARLEVPRRQDGKLLKSSDRSANDVRGERFIRRVFRRTAVHAAVVTGDCSSASNAEKFRRIEAGLNPDFRELFQSKPGEVIRFYAALEGMKALFSLAPLVTRIRELEIVFDRGTESPSYAAKVDEICSKLSGPFPIRKVQFSSIDDEPLILLPDWIAGATLRDVKKDDMPKTRETLRQLVLAGRLICKDAFEVQIPNGNPRPST